MAVKTELYHIEPLTANLTKSVGSLCGSVNCTFKKKSQIGSWTNHI